MDGTSPLGLADGFVYGCELGSTEASTAGAREGKADGKEAVEEGLADCIILGLSGTTRDGV